MPQEISITEDDIRFAEKILLPEGKMFDEERKAFICNLETIDLQAVPGSGKTTALLAKLIILERKLPFQDGSGILVLSHTNAAIDEIKHKIQKHCPKLFSYPNFIGTIQSFVDEFLAIPFYVNKFKSKPTRIDNEIYDEAVSKYLRLNLGGFTNQEQKNARYFLIGNDYQYSFRLNYEEDRLEVKNSLNGNELQISKPRRGKKWEDFSDVEKERIREWLIKFKYTIMKKEGALHFDDAYFLANLYLSKKPKIKNILQKRFPYIFVDEMQDMDTHQYNLLEKIFYDEGNSISKIQRIGDKNQAIYNSVKVDEVWEDREKVLKLSGSQRLSDPIANVVKKFALYNNPDFDIVGLNECSLKPHILLFENTTINNIIPCFAKLVKGFKESGHLTYTSKDVKIICWNTEWKEDVASRQEESKLRLEDYYNDFKKEKGKSKQDYDCLKSYLLYYEKNKNSLEPIRKNILNAFLKVLRLERIDTVDDKYFTKKKLFDFIKEKGISQYDLFTLNIYNWSIDIIKGKVNDVWNELRDYLPYFFEMFSKNPLSLSLSFINNDVVVSSHLNNNEPQNSTQNYYQEDDIEIEITSVHAVKGQTHSATLYLESYYYQDGRGENAKSYESQRLTEQFLDNSIDIDKIGDRVKQSAKMAYVGFSRPKNLLCIAIHKGRFDTLLSTINKDKWEIINV